MVNVAINVLLTGPLTGGASNVIGTGLANKQLDGSQLSRSILSGMVIGALGGGFTAGLNGLADLEVASMAEGAAKTLVGGLVRRAVIGGVVNAGANDLGTALERGAQAPGRAYASALVSGFVAGAGSSLLSDVADLGHDKLGGNESGPMRAADWKSFVDATASQPRVWRRPLIALAVGAAKSLAGVGVSALSELAATKLFDERAGANGVLVLLRNNLPGGFTRSGQLTVPADPPAPGTAATATDAAGSASESTPLLGAVK
jgi:hypothetical protein